ncbi:MAG: hypothetical protein HOP16_16010 [Acidobacteria bacterium]|nr:hypothetical protein [Acidobacteriota bacterium]
MNVRLFVLAVVSVVCAVAPAFGDIAPPALQWDASPEGNVAGYIVYVGQAPGSYDETYDVSRQTSFVYTKAVPGRAYFFSVAAYTSGSEVGPRSEEVLFLAGTPATLPLRSAAPMTSSPAADDAPRAVAARALDLGASRRSCTSSGECYEMETLAAVAGRATGLMHATDGRVIFMEDGRYVRVIENDQLVPTPALSVEDGSRIVALALDPGFEQTGFVYAGIVGEGADRQLDVVRYRAVANRLGEAAVIVAGLPLPEIGDASLAVDALRRVYVAMPRSTETGADRYSEQLLRFEQDGTTVRADGAAAPVYSSGYARPSSLVLGRAGHELWLGGADENGVGGLVRVSLDRESTGDTAIAQRVVVHHGTGVSSVAVPLPVADRSVNSEGDRPLTFVDETGAVFHLSGVRGDTGADPWMTPGQLGGIAVSVANGASGSDFYLAVASDTEPALSTTSIVRLRRK